MIRRFSTKPLQLVSNSARSGSRLRLSARQQVVSWPRQERRTRLLLLAVRRARQSEAGKGEADLLTSEGRKARCVLTSDRRERADYSKRGEGGIRTPDAGITDVTVFETAAFNHSATSPRQSVSTGSPPSTTSPALHDDLPNPVPLLPVCLDQLADPTVRFWSWFAVLCQEIERPAYERIPIVGVESERLGSSLLNVNHER